MPRRKIYTFDGVVDALGGLKAVAELTGVSLAAVCQWRKRDGAKFPARTHARIYAELARNNRMAPLHLWNFDPPREHEHEDEPKRRVKSA